MINRDSGQIALILVLIMTVVGAAAVSLAGRMVVETRVQEVNIDSSQAMLAAQAGLEQALRVAPTGPLTGGIDDNTTYSVTDETQGTNNAVIGPFKNGETWEINLSGFAGQLDLYWDSSPTAGQARGIYVTAIDASGVVDNAYAPAGFGSGFTEITAGSYPLGGRNFSFRMQNIPYPAGSTAVRVTLLGGDTVLGFGAATGALTAQVRQKISTGTVTRGTETIKQGLGYYESIADQVPGVFGYALYSGSNIVQE